MDSHASEPLEYIDHIHLRIQNDCFSLTASGLSSLGQSA